MGSFVGAALLVGCATVVVEHQSDGAGGGGASPWTTGAGAETSSAGGSRECPDDWTHILGGSGANWLRSHAVGPDGSVAVTVDSTADLSIDGVPLDLEDGGLVVIVFGPDGDLAWARRFGQSNQLPAMPVAFTPSGNVVVGGIGFGTIDLGDVVARQDGATGYVVSFSPSGVAEWIQSWSVPIESGGLGNMVVDGLGNIYFDGGVGYDGDTMNWGDLSTDGETFVGKILANGEPAWVRGFRGAFIERRALATTPEGHLVMGESMELEGKFGDQVLSTPGDFDALMVELDSDGAVVDARQFGDDALQRSGGFVIGPTGARALFGITWGEVDFGTGPVNAPGSDDVFLAAFDAGGTNTWTKTAPNTYAPTLMTGKADGGLALLAERELASALGCPKTTGPGFSLVDLDAHGDCVTRERVAYCSDDPYCEVYFGGLHVSPNRSIVSGYFSGGLYLRDALVTADIWDGFISSRGSCAEP